MATRETTYQVIGAGDSGSQFANNRRLAHHIRMGGHHVKSDNDA